MTDNSLQIDLQQKTEQLRQRDALIHHLEMQLELKNKLIVKLQTELEKFRSERMPLSKQLKRQMYLWSSSDNDDDESSLSSTSSSSSSSSSSSDDEKEEDICNGDKRPPSADHSRSKRLAISAEPTSVERVRNLSLRKVPKSDE